MIGQLVRVTWTDAWFDFEADEAAFLAQYPVETIGFLVREGDVISVAGEKLPNGWRAVTHIPRALVRSVHALEDGTLGVQIAPSM